MQDQQMSWDQLERVHKQPKRLMTDVLFFAAPGYGFGEE